MTLFVLSDDDLALLRFTCDLFFVAESPLVRFDKEPREPADYQATYQSLVDRKVIEPTAFRIADDALNRIAPVTECDARIVHIIVDDAGRVRHEDHWMLDEIAVVYEQQGDKHIFGPDLDSDELIARIGRRLLPRRAEGDRFDAILSAAELLATSTLLQLARKSSTRVIAVDDARAALLTIPSDDAVLPVGSGAPLLAMAKKAPPSTKRAVDPLLAGLIERKVLSHDAGGLRVHPAVFSLAGFSSRARHTLVRTDFRDDDWLVREVSFLPVEGSLFVIAPTRGGFRIAELDGDALRLVLHDATGPQSGRDRVQKPMRLATLLQNHTRKV